MIQAYTGNGKGKTTCAMGLLIRAFGYGKRVGAIFFDKGSQTYRHHELVVLDRLGIEYIVTGLERMTPDGKFRFGNSEEDRVEALKAIEFALKAIESKKFDLIVLDEALSAVTYGLLDKSLLENLMANTPKEVELILTGRCCQKDILDKCDLVTSMTKEKHYFDRGVAARPGIEF